VATVIYTSGTTGTPKGVMLTHRNIMSNIYAVLERIPVGATDSVLSFLPLSHVFERMAGFYTMLYAGARITYAAGIESVSDDLKAISPTVLITVPRFLEKVRDAIHESVSAAPAMRRHLIEWALRAGRQRLERRETGRMDGGSFSERIADRMILSRIRAELGGRLRFFISGGAPLPIEVNRFFHTLDLPVLEGYGLTETSPVLCVNTPAEWRIGSVGRPVPGVEVKIAPDGEILARGPNIMKGYLGREDETSQALKNGWFHTGDIGSIDPDGYLYITDRKKDIIVLSTGKNVSPQPIENRLRRSAYIREVVLIGIGRKFVTALIAPDLERLRATGHIAAADLPKASDLITDPRIRSIINDEIRDRSGRLAPFERIQDFLLVGREFRIRDGILTPTLKVRRRRLEEIYRESIDGMYA
jgi:long-chain acyl-CoA synthetase